MSKPLSDFLVRAASAAVLGVVMLAAILLGGVWGTAALAAVIAAAVLSEFYALSRRDPRRPAEVLGLAAAVALPLAAAYNGATGLLAVLGLTAAASLVLHVTFRAARLADTAIALFGVVYVGFTLAHLVLIRQLGDGMVLVLIMVVSVWVNDVFAYLAGSTLGRTPLAPRISPKKTWEGLAAGTIATSAVWIVAGSIFTSLQWPILLAAGVAASAAAAIGDLAESRFKREFAVKDSGRLLPGHGGFLDRFDSFILVTIVIYHVLSVLGVR